MRKLLLFLGLIIFSLNFAQSIIVVNNAENGKPLPGVTIKCKEQILGKTNTNGQFETKSKCNSLSISLEGYYSEVVLVEKNMLVNLSKKEDKLQSIETVIIKDESDPKALAILTKVQDLFKTNSPRSLDSYTFKSYEKFSMDIDEDSIANYEQSLYKKEQNDLKKKKESTKKVSDTATDIADIFPKSKLFLWERAQEFLYSKKYGEKINVLDTKISGLPKPIYELLALQNDKNKMPKQVQLENRDLYRYYLTDSLMIDGRETYKISFRDVLQKNKLKKNKYSGFIYIDKATYGIKQISNVRKIASDGARNSEWQLIDGKWFLDNETVRVKFGSIDLNASQEKDKNPKDEKEKKKKSEDEFQLYGFIKSKYFDIKTNEDQDSKDYKGYTYSVKNSDGSLLEKYRTEELTDRESDTYVVIDSLGDKYNMQSKAAILSGLLHGNLRYKQYNFNLANVIGYNQYEGLRLGINVKLNEEFNKYISPDAYIAYGFKDGDFKYGLGVDFKTSLEKSSFFRAEYFNDVKTAGRFNETFWDFFMVLSNSGVNLKNDRFYSLKGGSFSFERDLSNSLTAKLGATYQEEEALFAYNYANRGNQFENVNLKFSLKYAPFSRNIMTPEGKYTTEKKFPDFYLNVEQGLESLGGDYNYTRADILMNHVFKTKFGVTSNRLYAGKLFGDAPIWQHFTMNGLAGNGKINANLASYIGFATMKGGQYYNSEFVGQYFAHQIPWFFRTNGKRISSFSVIHRSIIGNMEDMQDHQFEFKKIDHLYQEIGLDWEHFLSSRFNLGLFYRVGYYQTPKFSDNIGIQLKLKVLGF
ncbi:DUF5686 family protein [Frigoriflavimonas asaccharolytica]|uniref:Carboxypeptidase-like protein n=1 Tax=Frigoriflavimonas asaccharolytica TaxID=2735899 RepID=A0A8J8K913_9FLAO|nr:DUF5686 family protein [Frigoriflavimonas asaccharolytica]NRS92567.1 hypothetical protein [Frigoriflavimonas asaccharolytica]